MKKKMFRLRIAYDFTCTSAYCVGESVYLLSGNVMLSNFIYFNVNNYKFISAK